MAWSIMNPATTARRKIGFEVVRVFVTERIFRRAVVAGFMMLQAMVRGLISQRVQKMILLVVALAIKLAGFGDKLFVAGQVLVRDLQRRFALANHVEIVRRLFSWRRKLDLAINGAGDQRRIHQPGE